MRFKKIAVAVPMMDELENVSRLLSLFEKQSFRDFELYVCVNQPDSWHDDGDASHRRICEDNASCIQMLAQSSLPLHVIDRSSPGLGWPPRKHGVGWARKILFEYILAQSGFETVIVSMDADTDFSSDYLSAVLIFFNTNPKVDAVAIPFYHPLSGNEAYDRSLLRYECYMRHYLIQMLKIGNPYAFCALGSAMAFTAKSYARVGGMSPLQGGEDFYLMQKFAKKGSISNVLVPGNGWKSVPNPDYSFSGMVFPQGRPSDRVPFGTGPAVSLRMAELESKYPFYAPSAFAEVKRTYDCFHDLYLSDFNTPMSDFLTQQLDVDFLWQPLRNNYKDVERFSRACVERVDGLRILQFLKSVNDRYPSPYPDLSFENDALDVLNDFRNRLFASEMQLREICCGSSGFKDV